MSLTNDAIGHAEDSTRRFSVALTRFFGLFMVTAVMALATTRVQAQDDEYFRIYTLSEQGDALKAKGNNDAAAAKYHEAQIALQSFQKTYPDWNKAVVSFRARDLAEKVSALAAKPVMIDPGIAAPATAVQSQSRPATPGGPQVKLLDAGTEPRKVLRLHPKPGDHQKLLATLKLGMNLDAGQGQSVPMKMPAIKLSMDVTVKDVSTEGDITYEMVMGDLGTGDDAGATPGMAEAMKMAMGGFKGTSGTAVISSRGFNKGAQLKMKAGSDPQMSQVVDQMKESLAQVAVTFPEEAVGPGAKWEVRTPIASQGMTLDQTASYQIVSIDGDRVSAKYTLSQRAANQKIENAAIPGIKVDLAKMTGTGTGDVTFDLAHVLATKGHVDSHTELSMNMGTGNQKQTMNMKMDVGLDFEAK